jgi:YtkA-like
MIVRAPRQKALWTLLATVPALLAIALLAATSNSGGSPFVQLQRPATFAAGSTQPATTSAVAGRFGPRPIAAVVHAQDYGLGLTLAPNRASMRNRLAIVLRHGGQPVTGARVTVVYGMPAMNMQNAYTSPLTASPNGTYAAIQPVLGMPGIWQLRVTVTPPHGAPFSVTINDLMAR